MKTAQEALTLCLNTIDKNLAGNEKAQALKIKLQALKDPSLAEVILPIYKVYKGGFFHRFFSNPNNDLALYLDLVLCNALNTETKNLDKVIKQIQKTGEQKPLLSIN